MRAKYTILVGLIILTISLWGCVGSKSRLGMVTGEDGLMYGSAMDRQFVVDSSLFHNNRIKLRVRNTSGDSSFDLHAFQNRLEDAYRGLGYEPVKGNDFGILLDVNVHYSGQIQEDMRDEFQFAGGAVGGMAGAYDPMVEGKGKETLARGAAGAIGGATIGYILGSYVTDDTYIVISDITLATVAPREKDDGTTIVFGETKKTRRKKNNFRGFRDRATTELAVYAGGRNVSQPEITGEVRERMFRILRDII